MNVKSIFTFMSAVLDRLYLIAEPQAGYFTTPEARDVGVSRQELYYLRHRGEIFKVAYGIQRLARFPASRLEDVVVACLWAGPQAVASHETGLVVFGLGDAMPNTIHVTVPDLFRGHKPGVTVHQARVASDERTYRDGVPVTVPLRTIADVARTDSAEARVALQDALERGVVRRGEFTRASERYPQIAAFLSELT